MKNFIRRWMLAFSASSILPNRARAAAFRLCGVSVGSGVLILEGCRVVGDNRFAIGSRSFVNREVYVDLDADVLIGEGVQIGPRCLLLTGTHRIGGGARRAGPSVASPIRIDNGCWLGAGVTILPGVRIQAGTVVAAGSVVTKSPTTGNVLLAGAPAAAVRELGDELREVDPT